MLANFSDGKLDDWKHYKLALIDRRFCGVFCNKMDGELADEKVNVL